MTKYIIMSGRPDENEQYAKEVGTEFLAKPAPIIDIYKAICGGHGNGECNNCARNVAVIDDSDSLCTMLQAALENKARKSGKECAVKIYPNGQDFLVACKNGEHYDVVLTDFNMPEMNGGEVIKEHKLLEQIKV